MIEKNEYLERLLNDCKDSFIYCGKDGRCYASFSAECEYCNTESDGKSSRCGLFDYLHNGIPLD